MDHIQKAFRSKNIQASARAHRHKEHHADGGEYLGDMVLGGTDGIITTFAVVSGVVGAHLSPGIIIVLGVANLLADGFSMAVGNYLSIKSDRDFYHRERSREMWEVENLPDHERKEIEDIFREKGFSGELLNQVVARVTSDKELWVDTMMVDELKLFEDTRNPYLVGALTFLSFVLFGSVPLLVYLMSAFTGSERVEELFPYCIAATGLALFLVGALRSRFTFRHWARGGVEILVIGGLAGGVSYGVGSLLRGFFPHVAG